MKQWIEPQRVQVSEDFVSAIGGHRLVAETLVRRGITDVQRARAFLNPALYSPAPSSEFPNINKAVERLQRAIDGRELICVWGDFDVDGQTSTTLLVSALTDLGARVVYHIPNRQTEGHGIHTPTLREYIDNGARLLLTCDTGIAAHAAVSYAQSQGIDVIVTDHHNLAPTLPDAYAIINPKLLYEDHPLRELPGVGVAYKLVEELYSRAGRAHEAEKYLDLVALGIVADVAVMTNDTRYLLQRGLDALRTTERLGLKTMIEIAELVPEEISEEHIGFAIGPRLNALGRLSDANVIVELFTTNNLERARILANQLDGLNNQRKLLSEQVLQGAILQIERDNSLLDDAALVLSSPHWHTGVVGIVANRLAERYNRPVILIATSPDGIGRGSARSVYGCDITAAIGAQEGMLLHFGGHTMAAGLSLQAERIPEFRKALSRTVKQILGEVEAEPTLPIDAYISLGDLSLDLVAQLERLAPFGNGNPALTLACKGLSLKDFRTIGRGQEHLQVMVEDENGIVQRVMWWQGGGSTLPDGRFDLAFVVRARNYQGKREIQVEWVEARPHEGAVTFSPFSVEVIDCRSERNPQARLGHLQTQNPDLAVWVEGIGHESLNGYTRHQLKLSPALVIWTAPPGPLELHSVLRQVAAQTVYLFAEDCGINSVDAFLKRLSGLVKYALSSNGGEIRISKLAAATAQRENTVRTGLDWLVAQGAIQLTLVDEDMLRVAKGEHRNGADLSHLVEQIQQMMDETNAYRRYFAHADAQVLMR